MRKLRLRIGFKDGALAAVIGCYLLVKFYLSTEVWAKAENQRWIDGESGHQIYFVGSACWPRHRLLTFILDTRLGRNG